MEEAVNKLISLFSVALFALLTMGSTTQSTEADVQEEIAATATAFATAEGISFDDALEIGYLYFAWGGAEEELRKATAADRTYLEALVKCLEQTADARAKLTFAKHDRDEGMAKEYVVAKSAPASRAIRDARGFHVDVLKARGERTPSPNERIGDLNLLDVIVKLETEKGEWLRMATPIQAGAN